MPGDGSAREQAASCQRVMGASANFAKQYATKRYRSNCINWGMLPFVTDTPDLTDEMYADASLHDAHGAWQMIFGVNTLPEYRKQGLAGQLLRRAIADAKAQGRRGLVLTCKDRLVHYYAGFGFVSEGVSGSTHGGVVWYQMRLTF